MDPIDAPEFFTTLDQVAAALYQTVSPQQQAGLWLALQEMPLDVYHVVCLLVMQQEDWVPKPRVWWDYAREIMAKRKNVPPSVVPEPGALLRLREASYDKATVRSLLAEIWPDVHSWNTDLKETAEPSTEAQAARKALLRAQAAQLLQGTEKDTPHA